uniref:SH3 domain-containing protein n=1 Tax=Caenorhabditis japonica TaxID=281687 RepID=A0A8R1DWU1_CAEJA
MTLNYHAHGKQIEESYRRVSDDSEGDKWVIYDYEGNSNTLRVGEEGQGGLEEFADAFSSGKLQFGVISVRLSSDVFPKIVLVHWQGEGVPTLRLASTHQHAEEFRRYLKTVHIVLHARSEIDVEPEAIRKEVRKLPAANASTNSESTYSIPEKVNSVYQPTKPHQELSSAARENFWSEANQQEKRRQAEEKTAQEQQRKQYEADRARTDAELQTQADNYQPEKVNSVYKPTKPHVELKTSDREEFWSKMNEEEKNRQAEEKTAQEQQRKQYEADRARTAAEIHTQAENYKPDKVASVYKPTKPHVEINSSAREEFWSKMNEEEKNRQAEEKAAQEAKQKEFESDRKRIAEDMHAKLELHEKTSPSSIPSSSNSTTPSVPTSSSGLVGSRKDMFNSKPSEPILPKPVVNGGGGGTKKWPPVQTNKDSEPVSAPVNRLTEQPERHLEEPAAYKPEPMVPVPVPPVYDSYEEPPAEPVPVYSPPSLPKQDPVAPPPPEPTPAHIASQYDAPPVFEPYEPPAQAPAHYASQYDAPPEPVEDFVTRGNTSSAQLPAHIASQYDMPPVMPEEPVFTPPAPVSVPAPAPPPIDQYDFPPVVEDQKAMALWDYQAADDTEISFDPDDIISNVDQVDSGWWKGRAPNGRVGLFPANYVKLL